MAGSVDGYVRAYDLRMGQLRTDFIGRVLSSIFYLTSAKAPVASVMPAQDWQTSLVTTLDSRVLPVDVVMGKVLNDFKGHKAENYRCRSCFGHGEVNVV